MAFKPLSQTVTSGKTLEIPSSAAVFSAIAAVLPSSVAGDVDKVLSVDALGVKSWQYAGLGAGSLGTNNVILGRSKPSSITTASDSILIGPSAGNALTSGFQNVFIGTSAGAATTTSSENTAVGYQALRNLVGGLGRGVAIGHEAAFSVTSAYITAVGYQAARNGGGETAVAIGTWAGRGGLGVRSIGIGYRASDNNTGSNNIAIGGDALLGTASVSNGGNNIAIGPSAGLAVTTGTGNVFVGNTAGDAVTTGSNNVIIGDIAGSTTLSDTIILASGTVERVRANNVGYVGINTTAPTAMLEVNGSAELSNGDLVVATAGNGVRFNTDTNSKLGTTGAFPATNPNTVTVSTTAVRSNSKIFATVASNSGGNPPGIWIDSITDATSFVIKAHDTSFAGTVNWLVIDPLYEPDSEAFFTAAGITDATQKLAVDTLVRDLKRYGLWSKMTAIYPFVGGTASAHSYNLKNTAQYQITWNGTVTHNSNGITGNGTNGYGNLNIAPNAIGTQNDQHISIYSRTDINQSSYDIYSVGASSDSGILIRFLGSFNPKINMTGWPNAAVSTSLGLFTASRTSSTLLRGYQNNITRYSPASYASATPSANNLFICAGNNGAGVANNFSTRNYAFASVGTGLDDTQAANLYTAVQVFQTILNRQV